MNLAGLLNDDRPTLDQLAAPLSRSSPPLSRPLAPPHHPLALGAREPNRKDPHTSRELPENPYAKRPVSYPTTYHQTQDPPTPPFEEKCTLPSISKLIDIADGPSPRNLAPPPSPQKLPLGQQSSNHPAHQFQPPPPPPYAASANTTNHRSTLPPSPPMLSDPYDSRNSPPSTSPSHLSSAPFFASAINNMDANAQRQPMSPLNRHRHSLPPSYQCSPAGSLPSYFNSPASVMNTPSSMFGQRSLPQDFPPPVITSSSITPAASSTTTSSTTNSNPWQHHHYISASSQSNFPPSQDRYICPTCNKAFSRPSSLRIHSHSHTGEKPFQCPHAGCGKAFSVRSNMKRHERGCHASSPSSV